MQSTFAERTLSNGLRIVCESMAQVRSAAVGFLVKTGARDEAPHEHGVSHFLEHMCFKGTARRDWQAITIGFDELGSIYNAFTGKEHTLYYGWVPAHAAEPQLELLADMMRPALPAEEFETERKVILEEIAMSADSFEHHVWNFLHQTVFGSHALAHEILGEKETIEKLPRETMLDYMRRRYAPQNVTLIASGALRPDAVFAAAERFCGDWGGAANGRRLAPPPAPPVAGVHKLRLPQFKQQTLALLYASVPHGHAQSETIEALCAILGGHNSRCYWKIVEKGVCSQAGAVWLSYADCGLLALFADGEPDKCDEMLAALREQAAEITRDGVLPDEVQRVKNQRRTHLALEAENPRTRLMQIIDDLEGWGKPRTPQERLAEVDAVTVESIADYLRTHPIDGPGLLISCGPRDWP
jgi:predicted Zn-dependent peptidase